MTLPTEERRERDRIRARKRREANRDYVIAINKKSYKKRKLEKALGLPCAPRVYVKLPPRRFRDPEYREKQNIKNGFRQWRIKHPGSAITIEQYAEERKRRREHLAKTPEAQKEKASTTFKNWMYLQRILEPERIMLRRAKCRAGRIGVDFSITRDDLLVDGALPQVCPALGIKFNYNGKQNDPSLPSIDRINNLKGYVTGNVRIISHRANQLKSDATPEEILCLAGFWSEEPIEPPASAMKSGRPIARELRTASLRDEKKKRKYEQHKIWMRNERQVDPTYHMIRRVRARAIRNGQQFLISKKDLLVNGVLPERCPVLGIRLNYWGADGGASREHFASVDRIDNVQGYIPGNVRIISYRANRLKRDGTQEDFTNLARYIYGELYP